MPRPIIAAGLCRHLPGEATSSRCRLRRRWHQRLDPIPFANCKPQWNFFFGDGTARGWKGFVMEYKKFVPGEQQRQVGATLRGAR